MKSGKAEASVSHATVELERGTQSPSSPGGSPTSPQDDMVGLSPAAKLARQHTLRSKAAEAAKTSAPLGKVDEVADDGTPSTWEKNTATRSTLSPGAQRSKKPIGEFGSPGTPQQQTWAEDLSDDEGTIDGHPSSQLPPQLGWRDPAAVDEDSDEEEQDDEAYDDEDDTVRISGEIDPMDEPWAIGVRRSVERTRVPAKGILKSEPALCIPLGRPLMNQRVAMMWSLQMPTLTSRVIILTVHPRPLSRVFAPTRTTLRRRWELNPGHSHAFHPPIQIISMGFIDPTRAPSDIPRITKGRCLLHPDRPAPAARCFRPCRSRAGNHRRWDPS